MHQLEDAGRGDAPARERFRVRFVGHSPRRRLRALGSRGYSCAVHVTPRCLGIANETQRYPLGMSLRPAREDCFEAVAVRLDRIAALREPLAGLEVTNGCHTPAGGHQDVLRQIQRWVKSA